MIVNYAVLPSLTQTILRIMANMDFIAPTGKYKDWNVYKLSLIIVDITDLFVKTYLPKFGDRTVDQMVLRQPEAANRISLRVRWMQRPRARWN